MSGPERAAELQEAWREIDHPEGTRSGLKFSFENVGVGLIALASDFAVSGSYAKAASVLIVEQRRTHGLGIEARQATPNDLSAVVNKGGELTISDHSQIFQAHG